MSSADPVLRPTLLEHLVTVGSATGVAHVQPSLSALPTRFEDELIEVGFTLYDARVFLGLLSRRNVDVGRLAEAVLRCRCAPDGLIDPLGAVATGDEHASHAAAERFEYALAEVGEALRGLGWWRVVEM